MYSKNQQHHNATNGEGCPSFGSSKMETPSYIIFVTKWLVNRLFDRSCHSCSRTIRPRNRLCCLSGHPGTGPPAMMITLKQSSMQKRLSFYYSSPSSISLTYLPPGKEWIALELACLDNYGTVAHLDSLCAGEVPCKESSRKNKKGLAMCAVV